MNSLPIGRPRFITIDEALAFHEMSIEHFGGALGIRDAGMLDAALAMPRQSFGGEFAHAYPMNMAAAYAFHIAKNHPFVDGNKRTALMCCGAFLRLNGWDLVSTGETAADAIVALVAGTLDKDGFAAWLQEHCAARVSWELRDFFAALSLDQLQSLMGTIGATVHPERLPNTSEAELAIPLIRQTIIAAIRADEQGDANVALQMHHQRALLMSIFRLAQDMGYEW